MKDITSNSIQELIDKFDSLPDQVEWEMHPEVFGDPRAIEWLIENNCFPRAYLAERVGK